MAGDIRAMGFGFLPRWASKLGARILNLARMTGLGFGIPKLEDAASRVPKLNAVLLEVSRLESVDMEV